MQDGLFHCYKCRSTIKGISEFKEHYKTKHGPEVTKKFFACSLCKTRSYTTAKALTTHLKNQHTKQFLGEPKKQKKTKGGHKRKWESDDDEEVRLQHFQIMSDLFELFIF